jgi:hypothetical protein
MGLTAEPYGASDSYAGQHNEDNIARIKRLLCKNKHLTSVIISSIIYTDTN